MKIKNNRFIFLAVIISAISCGKAYLPKPRGYMRFDLPQKEYRTFDCTGCPFKFEYPTYATITPQPGEPYWFNMDFPDYKSTLYLSYKTINNNFGEILEDSHNFLFKHTVKADDIREQEFYDPQKRISGFIFDIKGNVATSVQFYATDSVKHFLRGSLYFYCEPNKDSLAPLIDFFRRDIVELVETLEFG